MFPVQRTWIVNENSGSKIRRHGFTLLPDYASTAFMIQGATLGASIADCGDILDIGGLSELMTTYVILSRVKSADGLLLLRAFCHNLFQMGALPGPSCLLKMLRSRFQAHASADEEYGTEAALTEYKELLIKHQAWKTQRTHFGPEWRCGDCGLCYPAAGYGIDRRDTTRLNEGCVGLGHWRCCTVCATVRASLKTDEETHATLRACAGCGEERPTVYYDDASDICRACQHQRCKLSEDSRTFAADSAVCTE